MEILNQPSIAILIDCWSNCSDKFLYKRIAYIINNNPNIKTVVLASYNCRREREVSDSVWYLNYNNFFIKEHQHSRKIKDLEHIHRHYEKQDTKFPNEDTDPYILNYKNPEKFQIAMKWRWELDLYLEKHPEIKNIYMFGIAWDICVKVRPLGYDSLAELDNINILTNMLCVNDSSGNRPTMDSNWTQVVENTYKYVHDTKIL